MVKFGNIGARDFAQFASIPLIRLDAALADSQHPYHRRGHDPHFVTRRSRRVRHVERLRTGLHHHAARGTAGQVPGQSRRRAASLLDDVAPRVPDTDL